MEWGWILGIVGVSWFMWSLRHMPDYSRDPFWVQVLGCMVYDLYLFRRIIKEVVMMLLSITAIFLFPVIWAIERAYVKWLEKN